MLVLCKKKIGRELPTSCLKPEDGYTYDYQFAVEIDKTYIVYAMTIYSGYIWYYICDQHYTDYPAWNPSPLFEVIDGRLSKYWIYSCVTEENHTKTIWAYHQWVKDPYYYDQLTDGASKEVEIFKYYKNLMDVEFPDPAIKDCAQILDEEWLLCPICIDAWKCRSEDGMVICPNCKKMFHNPRYKTRSNF